FYLRVEAVNLSHFIANTHDLSTIRGGNLLLLEAMDRVETLILKKPTQTAIKLAYLVNQVNAINALQTPTQTEKNKKKNLKEQIKKLKDALQNERTPTITKGASWGLFLLYMTATDASELHQEVINDFKTDARYQHATFVVDLHPDNGDYKKDRDSVEALNHWQQLQSPSLAIRNTGIACCSIDKLRPADSNKWLKDQQQDYVSESVGQRRDYGRKQKHQFYKNITGINAKFTQDFGDLSRATHQGILADKIAVLYIDGNNFGKIQKSSDTAEKQKQFDQNTRAGREKVLTQILEKIRHEPDWLTGDDEVRLETLLWGGDEIMWVVPAWQGWFLANEFFIQAKQHITHNNATLTHAAGLVFCHHDAPIHRIQSLAKSLADLAKANRNENLLAYQILESFDHVGTALEAYRQKRLGTLGQLPQLLVNAKDMTAIQTAMTQLKNDDDFAKRKIYQILQAYQDNPQKAGQYLDKLPPSSAEPLKNLQDIFGGENTHWLHLMDLWDYIG
ncbi:MAG: hypothetical protein HOP34_11070, partial [Methylococcaceae bacterium]|nr:hypothetical protein [Methylococcaceae bacterium]